MKVAIMQPYFFPYIGYWQLINAVDTYIIFDDVNFIKQGYVNRNSILTNSHEQRITLEVIGASSNMNINLVKVGNNAKKVFKGIKQAYVKAPEYSNVLPLLQSILESPEKNLAQFLGQSIKRIASFLDVNTKIIYSSDLKNNKGLTAQDKILDMCNYLNVDHYINAIGGQLLYDKSAFANRNIQLSFLKPWDLEYKQLSNAFIPNLSIIDVLMFNSKEEVNSMLNGYDLV